HRLQDRRCRRSRLGDRTATGDEVSTESVSNHHLCAIHRYGHDMANLSVATTDYHTAGEPFRIVADPPVGIEGNTVAERRVFAIDDPDVDRLRRLLCFEPRGHADMYGGFITPPDDAGAHFRDLASSSLSIPAQ